MGGVWVGANNSFAAAEHSQTVMTPISDFDLDDRSSQIR